MFKDDKLVSLTCPKLLLITVIALEVLDHMV